MQTLPRNTIGFIVGTWAFAILWVSFDIVGVRGLATEVVCFLVVAAGSFFASRYVERQSLAWYFTTRLGNISATAAVLLIGGAMFQTGTPSN